MQYLINVVGGYIALPVSSSSVTSSLLVSVAMDMFLAIRLLVPVRRHWCNIRVLCNILWQRSKSNTYKLSNSLYNYVYNIHLLHDQYMWFIIFIKLTEIFSDYLLCSQWWLLLCEVQCLWPYLANVRGNISLSLRSHSVCLQYQFSCQIMHLYMYMAFVFGKSFVAKEDMDLQVVVMKQNIRHRAFHKC